MADGVPRCKSVTERASSTSTPAPPRGRQSAGPLAVYPHGPSCFRSLNCRPASGRRTPGSRRTTSALSSTESSDGGSHRVRARPGHGHAQGAGQPLRPAGPSLREGVPDGEVGRAFRFAADPNCRQMSTPARRSEPANHVCNKRAEREKAALRARPVTPSLPCLVDHPAQRLACPSNSDWR